MIDVLIIGSGPAGYSAGIYAARANLNTLMVSGWEEGGQLMLTTDVENYPGFEHAVQGSHLMDQMKKQAENVGVKMMQAMVTDVDFVSRPFSIKTDLDETINAKTIIIATGAQAKWLGLESEKKFQGYGVSGCATCDGFFFKNKKVAVIGGGNTAVEEALYLTNHASEVILIHRKDTLRAEKILQDRLFKNTKIKVIWNASVKEIIGAEDPLNVTGIILNKEGSEEKIAIDGVFVAIGHKPSTVIFSNTTLQMDKEGYIIVQAGTTQTNINGVFAAGDVQDKIYRQAVTAAGTGCMAALDAQKFLENNKS
ncbi:MAG: thioredoxin reductase (NADPH) [Candidatus Deianiraeaceae bacterium]|jgi:thioredoxin reductase (NADPH)